MTQKIEINPVTRIEGHAKITLHLDDRGNVQNARLHITQVRGFEKFCEGRPLYEMPSLMARICGICPVSHLLASAKACDALMAVQIPETAVKLRRILNLGQIIQSHALSFFHLSSPDLLLGMDSDPAQRHIFGVAKVNPQLAKDGIRLRQFGQQVIETLGGKRIHPAWVVPGGVNEPLSAEKRDLILGTMAEVFGIAERTLDWFEPVLKKFKEEIEVFGNFPTLFMGLANAEGTWEHYDGKIRIIYPSGQVVGDQLDPARYPDYIGEAVEPWSYLKFPYYEPKGYPDGIYRVGPLARLNLIQQTGGPRGDRALAAFQALQPGPVSSSFHQHFARLVEIITCLEEMERLLQDPSILSPHVRAHAGPNALEGVGVSEAPRGILFHHYKINEHGQITWANLIIATGHNNLAMNKSIQQVARHFVKGKKMAEGMLNRVEAVIRAYDPCLSCSTHALGKMPIQIQLVEPTGEVIQTLQRNP
ncbi:MAG: Ni/Fe hydrogenase subunit alpha [Elusimicrobiota bacterium]|jgi:NAD-reducing hydrogenase large subunit